MSKQVFYFKQFSIAQDQCTMKVGTDGVLLGAWVNVKQANQVLDIGTGTGLIALMIAQRNPNAFIYGVEIDRAAYLQALDNTTSSPWANRIIIEKGRIQTWSKQSNQTFDLIVSNPPFFPLGTAQLSENIARNQVRHTTNLSFEDLLLASTKLMTENGRLAIILPLIEGHHFIQLASEMDLNPIRITQIRPTATKPIHRLMIEFKKGKQICKKSEMVIQHQKRNDFTEEYIRLTKEFYLKM